MIYGRFRAGETSAELTWMGGTPVRYDGDQQPPRAQRPAPPRDDHICPRAAAMPSQRRSSRGWSLLGPAGVLRYPSTSLLRATPGSASVIPPATEADLPNRQGPCLRSSSPGTPLRRQKCLFPDRENETSSSTKAVTTHKSDGRQASSHPGLYHRARHQHHPPPTAVRDGKRSSPAAHRRSGNRGASLRIQRRGRVVFD